MKVYRLSLSILLMGWILASTGCTAPATAIAPTAALLPSASVPAPTASPMPTASRAPSATRIVPLAQIDTPVPAKVDLSLAGLRLEDFSAGFEVLDAADEVRLGLTPELLYHLFEGTFQQASPVNHFAFHTSESAPFEVVIGVMFYPLLIPEQAELDHILADPHNAMSNFSQGFGGQAQLTPEMSRLADAAVGWTFVSESGQSSLKGEMVIFRRGEAAAILMALYQADQNPPAGLAVLAPRFDQRIRQALGY